MIIKNICKKLDGEDLVVAVLEQYKITAGMKPGLVIIDQVCGFVTPGAGNLAPPAFDSNIEFMVKFTNVLARAFVEHDWPILVLNERHKKGILEPPYRAHCEEETGEDLLEPRLRWLYDEPLATVLYKNCINGIVGGIQPDGSNVVFDWVNNNQITSVINAGICTEICVAQFVQALLSARNKIFDNGSKLLPTLKDVVVLTSLCRTYDLPLEVVKTIEGLPDSAAHPRKSADFIGLWMMQTSGAVITEGLDII